MKFNEVALIDGYKILQLADCHISYPFSSTIKKTISEIIQKEMPDLIVFTGDQFHNTCYYEEGILLVNEFINFIDSFEVNWCFAFGNHDPEINVSKREILQTIINKSQFFIGEIGPNEVTKHHEKCDLYKDERIGNYYFKLLNDNKKVIVMILDSGRYDDDGSYASLTPEQLNYVEQILKTEQADSLLLFFHIALLEHGFAYERFLISGKRREDDCAQNNSPDFLKVISNNTNDAMIFCGHDHLNDYVACINNIQLGITPGICYESYNEDEVRGYRIFEFENNKFNTRIGRVNDKKTTNS